MQVNLPIHQPSGCQEIFNGIDAFGVHHQLVVHHIKHLDDAGRSDVSFSDTREERVAPEVIKTIHIQLTADELVQETLGILVLEDHQGKVQRPVHLLVDLFHHQ